MRRTISGETLNKVKILEKKELINFLESEIQNYKKFSNKNAVYQNKVLIDNAVLNYLNCNKYSNEELFFIKSVIKNEFDKCELEQPYAGDFFVHYLFNEKNIKDKINSFLFHKSMKKEFINTITDNTVKKICNIFFDNFSLENTVIVEKHLQKDIKIIKNKDLEFKIDFDLDFYNNVKTISEYKIILLDGFIENVGEIHHLLDDSNKNRQNYVIFCYGMSGDVKNTILKNNLLKKTFVYPISFSLQEENINILHDISLIHKNAPVVSAQSGQTISQMFSEKNNILPGKKLKITKNSFIIAANCNPEQLLKHRNYLENRILESKNEKNTTLLKNRLKRMSANNIAIYIPDFMFKENNFIRNLHYMLKFFENCGKKLVKIKSPDKKKFYYFTLRSIFIVREKIKSFREKIKNIEKLIVIKKGDKNGCNRI